jgi:hypothetical protein
VGILGVDAAELSPDAPSAGRGFADGGWQRALCSQEPPGRGVTSNLVRASRRRRRRHRRVRDHARADMRAVGRRRGEACRRMKSRRMVIRAWAAGAVCEEPSVVGRVSGEACGESSGPRRSGTKFRGTDGKEESRGCAATRCSSESIVCCPARPSTSPTRVVSISTAPASMIVIGPCLTAHRSAVRIRDDAYRPAATYAGVSREEDEPSSSSSEARQERRERVSAGYTERQKFLAENRASASAPASARMSAA